MGEAAWASGRRPRADAYVIVGRRVCPGVGVPVRLGVGMVDGSNACGNPQTARMVL
jgi:hypothetical protein